MACEPLVVKDHRISVSHPMLASKIARALIKSLSPDLDLCRVEHDRLELQQNGSRIQCAEYPFSKSLALKREINPHTLQLCDVIINRSQPSHCNETGTNMRHYEVTA